jgi:DNA-binding CsgD family transcriptional regulator
MAQASSFTELAAVATTHASALGVMTSLVALYNGDRQVVLTVDDVADRAEADRLALAEHTVSDPLAEHMFATHAPVGDELRTVPLLEPTGPFGCLRFAIPSAATPALHRDLDLIGTYFSVRAVQLGITAAPSTIAALSPRQRQAAELAARGLTNLEIATECATSINTVKKHLKVVFDRLQIASRLELATLLARTSLQFDQFPVGVTRVGEVWVTRV